MTVNTELARAEFAWTGVESAFAAGFPANQAADVGVFFRTPAGVITTLLAGVNFSVTLASGSKLVTVVPLTLPPAPGTIVVRRSTPALVTDTLQDGEGFSLEIIQRLHDMAAMRSAEDRATLDRAIKLEEGAALGEGDFDLGGSGIANLAPGTSDNHAATVGQIQELLAGSGNVPAPVLGDLNRLLVATGPGTFGWVALALAMMPAGFFTANAAGLAKFADGFLAASPEGRAKTGALYTQPSMISELAAPVGGRLTLISGLPVLTTTVSAATAVYYAPYLHDALPLYNGTVWTWRQFSELTLTLDATGHTANAIYDVFAFDDGGVLRIGTGPAWASDTARGTGAGTTELARLAGRLTNAVAITLRNASTNYAGIGIGRALYLGSIRTGSAGQVNFVLGAAASGGIAASIGIFNAYNRVPLKTTIVDNGTGYTYNSNTLRAPRGGTGMRANFLIGQPDGGMVGYRARATCGVNSGYYRLGIGLDSTSAQVPGSSLTVGQDNTSVNVDAIADWSGPVGIGWHYLTTLESSDTVPTVVTFNAASSINIWSQAQFEGAF